MFGRQSSRYKQFGWILLGIVLFCPARAALCGEPVSRVGTLHLDGKGIEILALQDDTGREKVFQRPGTDVVLPGGRYRIERIVLLGDRPCRPGEFPADRWLVVDPNARATLSVGAPLRQVIAVRRQGPVMVLTYELIGQGGEHYEVHRAPDHPGPSFAVYRSGRQVASGDFEFG